MYFVKKKLDNHEAKYKLKLKIDEVSTKKLHNSILLFLIFSPNAVAYIYVPYPTMIFEHLLKLITLVRRKKKKISQFNLNHINNIRKEEIANSELCCWPIKLRKLTPRGLALVPHEATGLRFDSLSANNSLRLHPLAKAQALSKFAWCPENLVEAKLQIPRY